MIPPYDGDTIPASSTGAGPAKRRCGLVELLDYQEVRWRSDPPDELLDGDRFVTARTQSAQSYTAHEGTALAALLSEKADFA